MVRNMIVVKVKSVVQRGIFGLFLFECLDELKHACYIEGKEPVESESWTDEGDGVKISEAVGGWDL